MRNLFELILMEMRSIARKRSYPLVLCSVIGAIFLMLWYLSFKQELYLNPMQVAFNKWNLLFIALGALYFGAVRTAMMRRTGFMEVLLSMPVKRNQILTGFYIGRLSCIYIPVLIIFLFGASMTGSLTSNFFSILIIVFSLLIFMCFFLGIGYYFSFLFPNAWISCIVGGVIILIFWQLAFGYPYLGTFATNIQQSVFKLNSGFNPFIFMAGLGFENFFPAPFLFMIVMSSLFPLLSQNALKHSGWLPGDKDARFTVRKSKILKALLFTSIGGIFLCVFTAANFGFYGFDFTDDEFSPSETLVENMPDAMIYLNSGDANFLPHVAYFEKLRFRADSTVNWHPTAKYGWSGAISATDTEVLCLSFVLYIPSDDLIIKSFDPKISAPLKKRDFYPATSPNFNLFNQFETIFIGQAMKEQGRNRIILVGENNHRLYKIFQNENYDVVPATLDNLNSITPKPSSDVIVVSPSDFDNSGKKNKANIKWVVDALNSETAIMFIISEPMQIPQTQKINVDSEQKSTIDSIYDILAKYGVQFKPDNFVAGDEAVITDASNNKKYSCETDYKIFAPWGAQSQLREKNYISANPVVIKVKKDNWVSLVKGSYELKYKSNKNEPVNFIVFNKKKKIMVANIQTFLAGQKNPQEIERNLITNALNISANRKLNNNDWGFNLIRKPQKQLSGKKIFHIGRNIGIIQILAYIIWIIGLLLSVYRLIRKRRLLIEKN